MVLAVIHAHILIKAVGDPENVVQKLSVVFHVSPFKWRKFRARSLHSISDYDLVVHMHEVHTDTFFRKFTDLILQVLTIDMHI